MEKLLRDAAQRALNYLDEIRNRSVAPSPEALSRLAELNIPFPEDPTDPLEVLRLLDEYGSPATMATAGPRFFGFVIGGVLPAALAANWLAGAWDQNVFSGVVSPVGAALEDLASRWVLEALGLPEEAVASFATGATMANFTALAAARSSLLARAGWDVERDGLFGAPEIKIVAGEEAHPTLFKSLGLLGLGRGRATVVRADGQGRFRADRMPSLDDRTLVCLQAGNVNTGAFDPFEAVCDEAAKAGAWVHVDGAFGLWALASPQLTSLTRGLTRADSWATDGHKWLNTPYDCGLAVVRDPEPLRRAVSLSAAYLPADFRPTPEASRRGRGIEVWAALLSLGRSGLADLIDRTCAYARCFADGLRRAGFEILNDVVLNQVLVSFGDQKTLDRVLAAVQAEGVCWCGGTNRQGRPAMRISVSSWATNDDDVEKSLASIIRAAGPGSAGPG